MHRLRATGVLSREILCERFKSAEQIFLAHDARDLIADTAVFEKQERRDRADVVFESETLVIVYIYLRYLDRIGFFARNFLQQGRDHFAWPAPFGPKIDDDRLVALHDFPIEVGFI
jgi:hypothetical protein